MIQQFRFYFKHSINDLRVNGQRTLFAILAVAAGVAAIVSLQTVAVLIDDALTDNVQQQTRGDIRLSISGGDSDVRNGDLFVESSIPEEFDDETNYYFHPDGIARMQTWLDENYPNSEITYRAVGSDIFGLFIGTGNGTVMTTTDDEFESAQILPFFIPSETYPFFDTIETVDGTPIGELLNAPTDIIIGQNIADDLEAEIGDVVRLQGSIAEFTIAGVVEQETAAREPNIGFVGAIFGFFYIDASAIDLFDIEQAWADTLFIRLGNPDDVDAAARGIRREFRFVDTNTTTEILEQNEEIVAVLAEVVTVVGLLALLIGSIGIINTMQVVVRRRTLEVAVLKTIGLQANQVTLLFLTEAFIMGVLGSLVGILLGWGATFIIKESAIAFTGQDLAFRVAWQPVFNGVFVGTLVTTVFGFMPTLSAGQVRPGLVLRPSERVIPRAGIIRNLLAILFIIVALSLITHTILGGAYLRSLAIVGGSFIVAGLMFVLLLFVIWVIARFMPTFGSVDLKVSLRQMLTTRGRGAITLLALVVGIFSLSTITMFTETFNNLLDFAIDEGTRGSVLVTASAETVPLVENAINSVETVNSYWIDRRYDVSFESIVKADTGEEISASTLTRQTNQLLREEDNFRNLDEVMTSVGGITIDQAERNETEFVAGRNLSPDDEGQSFIVLRDEISIQVAGIELGDTINYRAGGETLSFVVIGIEAGSDFDLEVSPRNYALLSAFPENLEPEEYSVQVDIPEENVRDLRQAVAGIPGAIVLDLGLFITFIQTLLDQFRAFPTLVALLGLAVGGIVIANSVALATIERRHEIAIMKSVGLQRERVLGMILLENAILGLIGGLIGVGMGLIALSVFMNQNDIPTNTIPYDTGAILMGLCILVALIAAVSTAWGASGEKPLNVLRYE